MPIQSHVITVIRDKKNTMRSLDGTIIVLPKWTSEHSSGDNAIGEYVCQDKYAGVISVGRPQVPFKNEIKELLTST